MYLLATGASRHSGADLTVYFRRAHGSEAQEHYYGFGHAKVTLGSSGRSAPIRADLGSYGHVNLDFALGRRPVSLPAGCHGAIVSQHSGSLTRPGGFDLVTHSSYLGTVKQSSIPAFITALHGPGLQCKPKPSKPVAGVTQLSSTALAADRSTVNFVASRSAKGNITEDLLVVRPATSPDQPTVLDAIQANGLPAADFTHAADLSAAHAVGPGPWLSGSVSFTGSAAADPKPSVGSVSGSLTAHFDGLGPVSATTGVLSARLSRN